MVMGSEIYHAVAREIALRTDHSFEPKQCQPVGGGCINETVILRDGARGYFVKLNRAELAAAFEAEALGLCAIRDSGAIRAPEPVCTGVSGERSWLALEFVSLRRTPRDGGRRLGAALAAMHRCTGEAFGWHRDNAIGATPQVNTPGHDWLEFWSEHRLGYQLRLAGRNGCSRALLDRAERLMSGLPTLLADHRPEPSLVHGDLWSGNAAWDERGMPVVFDPALYYGDRETDVAMTELFGGFDADFHAAYRDAWALKAGYPARRDLYNLYHVLNHYNLFGGHYEAHAARLVERLLSEIG